MTIGILQCGVPPEALRSHGSYGAMVRRLLGPGRDTILHDAMGGAFLDMRQGRALPRFFPTASTAGHRI